MNDQASVNKKACFFFTVLLPKVNFVDDRAARLPYWGTLIIFLAPYGQKSGGNVCIRSLEQAQRFEVRLCAGDEVQTTQQRRCEKNRKRINSQRN